MTSDGVFSRDAVRRWLPWGVWVIALAMAVPLCWTTSGLGVAPAEIEVREVSLTSPRSLRIAAVLVSAGEAVKQDQPLVQLDPLEVDIDLAIARAELQRLELDVASRDVTLRDERTWTISRLSGDAERAALDVSQVVADAERDRSELAQLTQQIAREEKLVADQLTRTDTLNAMLLHRAALSRKVEESGTTVQQARANAGATAQRLGALKASARPGVAGSADHLGRQLAPARAAAEAQRERVHQLEILRGRLELKAPFDGRIGMIRLRAGAMAAAGAPVLDVVDDRPTTAIAYVDQRWSARVHVGDRVDLAPSDRSGPSRVGHVTALSASIGELPPRFRPIPTEPAFGRSVFVQLDAPAPLPGQAFNATFHRAPESAP